MFVLPFNKLCHYRVRTHVSAIAHCANPQFLDGDTLGTGLFFCPKEYKLLLVEMAHSYNTATKTPPRPYKG